MSRIVITHATVLPGDAELPVQQAVDVVIEGDTIVAVGKDAGAGLTEGAEVIDASGAVVMPGLIDTHMHAWEYAWRGVTMRKTPRYNYMELLWKTHGAYTPQDTRESILGASVEMIDHGITGVLDYMHGANQTAEHTDGALDAYRTTGQRAMLSIGTKSAYSVPDDVFTAARQDRIADVERLRAAAADQPQLDVATALITPDPRRWNLFQQDIADTRSLGARMTFHANEIGEFAHLEGDGLLGSDIVPSHGNRASDSELAALARAGVILSVSPYTEIGSGKSVGVVNRAVRAGVKVAISIDTPPSVVPLNEFGQLRQYWTSMVLVDKLVAREGGRYMGGPDLDPQTMSLDEAVQSATVHGALALGYDNLGRIAAGNLADVLVLRPRPGALALQDPAAYAVLSQPTPEEISEVIINGVIKKRAGVLVGVGAEDIDRINAGVQARVMEMIG